MIYNDVKHMQPESNFSNRIHHVWTIKVGKYFVGSLLSYTIIYVNAQFSLGWSISNGLKDGWDLPMSLAHLRLEATAKEAHIPTTIDNEFSGSILIANLIGIKDFEALKLGNGDLQSLSVVEDEALFEEQGEGVQERDLEHIHMGLCGDLLLLEDEVHKFFVFVKEFGLLGLGLRATPFQESIHGCGHHLEAYPFFLFLST
ncbi:hypothetical protein E2542_SST12239 [Spatholobus suberectus]|nr:hypothetical protein E2542_SST12239 [Spatholobus suberectus]